MIVDIFIRTYHKDLEWLEYCLRSIAKYATGYRDIIICIPKSQAHLLNRFGLTREKVVTCREYKADYIGQQLTKLRAFEYTDAEAILYTDSDCVFSGPFDVCEMLHNGSPIVYKTEYSKVGDAICWKEPTEKYLGYPVEYEYMRRQPLLFYTDTIKKVHNLIAQRENEILLRGTFSEFNLLGAYAEKNESDRYHFVNTDTVIHNQEGKTVSDKLAMADQTGIKKLNLLQFWSWGGLTDEIKAELNELLK